MVILADFLTKPKFLNLLRTASCDTLKISAIALRELIMLYYEVLYSSRIESTADFGIRKEPAN